MQTRQLLAGGVDVLVEKPLATTREDCDRLVDAAARGPGQVSVGFELRGFPYYSFAGNRGFHANAELRIPIIKLALTPIGLLGPIRGTTFLGVGGARFKGEQWQFASSQPGFSYINDPVFGEPATGRRLVDGRASYGFGLQMFFLGYPMHFDWTKFTDFAVTSNNWDFTFWIGYDF